MLEVKRFASGAVTLEYVQKGDRPRWLIHTGTHGNEAGVIRSVRKFFEDSWKQLPDFLWVMAASPSAVRLGTRENQYGHDLNRMFFDGTTDPEAKANLVLLQPHTFEVFVSVHEDPDRLREFYLYDSADERSGLQRFFEHLTSQGIQAFAGIDDPLDPTLGNQISGGYYSLIEELRAGRALKEDPSTFDYFYRLAGVTGRQLNPEIPGQANQSTKDLVVNAFFEYLLDWWRQKI